MGMFSSGSKAPPKVVEFAEGDKVYAHFETSMGAFKAELFHKECPMTVGNFAALAKGEAEYVDPRNGEPGSGPYYDGTLFHRVIKDFMLQGGDPTGTGTGGPGYKFADEIVPALRHDQPGILSMANAGPGTNGSQFFVTEVATPWLDGKHTVFGKVIEGMDIVLGIAACPKGAGDRPNPDVVLKAVRIEVAAAN